MRSPHGSIVAILLCAVFGFAQEKPSASWTHIGDSKGGDNAEAALVRTPDGVLHIFWTAKHGSTFDLLHNAVSPAGQLAGSSSPVVTGWMALNPPAAVVSKEGVLNAFVSGIRSLNASEVFSGAIARLTGNADGTAWQMQEQPVSSLRSAGASPVAAGPRTGRNSRRRLVHHRCAECAHRFRPQISRPQPADRLLCL